MATKPIVLVDMDGVLADFEQGCLSKWRELYPTLPFIPKESRTIHDIADEYARIDKSYKPMMDLIMREDKFYENLPLIENAEKVLDEMESEGYEVFICTSQLRDPSNMMGKTRWIEKHFGKKWQQRIIITRDKTIVHGDIIIDDKPKITGVRPHSFTHILFDQPYNKQENKPRVMNWNEWKDVVSNVLSK